MPRMTSSHAGLPAGEIDANLVETWKPPYFGRAPVEEEPEAQEPAEEAPPEIEYHLPTAEEVAAIEEAAREAGHASGFDQGYQDGRERAEKEAEAHRQAQAEQAAQELASAVAALEEIARQLADPLINAADELEPELLLLATTLARRVIMAELNTRSELVEGVLHQALQRLPSRHMPVQVRVNPEDLAVVETYAEAHDERIQWVADAELTRGGCLIEAGPSRIDATIETRLAQAIDAVWGELSRPEDDLESEPDPEPEYMPEPEPRADTEPQPPEDTP